MRELNEQLIFDLSRTVQIGIENFYISESNTLAVNTIRNWRDWPAKKLLLLGPAGSGKSHLANFWMKESRAIRLSLRNIRELDHVKLEQGPGLILDDADEIKSFTRKERVNLEEKLFHLLNYVAQKQYYFMMTSSTNIDTWGLQLPDLISRLSTMACVKLLPPDDELLLAVLIKQFDDKQLKVSPQFLLFVIKRINRSFESIRDFVDLIDKHTLKSKRDVTIPVASKILDSFAFFNNKDIKKIV